MSLAVAAYSADALADDTGITLLAGLATVPLLWPGNLSMFPPELNGHVALIAAIVVAAALDRGRRADWVVSAALVVSLCSAGVGVAVAVGAVVHCALVRPGWRRWVAVLVPIAGYGAWLLTRDAVEFGTERKIEAKGFGESVVAWPALRLARGMTAHKPGDPTTLNRLYGRSKGKPLRAGQQALVDTLLPQIAVPGEGPVTAERLFGSSRPLHFEIGFGGGEHLAWQAAARCGDHRQQAWSLSILGRAHLWRGEAQSGRHVPAAVRSRPELRQGRADVADGRGTCRRSTERVRRCRFALRLRRRPSGVADHRPAALHPHARDGQELGLPLRRARPDDVDPLHDVMSSPQAMRYWSTPPHANREATAAFFAWTWGVIYDIREGGEPFVAMVRDVYIERSLLKRSVLPEDVAEAVAFFASDLAAKSTGNIFTLQELMERGARPSSIRSIP